jgi:hypothetical protein
MNKVTVMQVSILGMIMLALGVYVLNRRHKRFERIRARNERFRNPSKCFDCERQSPVMGKDRCFDCEKKLGSGLTYQLGFPPPAARLHNGA